MVDRPRHSSSTGADEFAIRAPVVEQPKGGGAIQGIGESFKVSPATGTASFSIPLTTSPSRGLTPELALAYDSGSGNGPFGLGWDVGVPSISRRTSQGLPTYTDDDDTFVITGAEDLVPADALPSEVLEDAVTYEVQRYFPRTEGAYTRIEKWTDKANRSDVHWRTHARDNTRQIFGRTEASRVSDPNDSSRIFEWKLDQTVDEVGNLVQYTWVVEDMENVPLTLAEYPRRQIMGCTWGYLKAVQYGNRTPFQPGDWMFTLVFDYGEHDAHDPEVDEPANSWPARQDAFSTFRAGFDRRCYRLCRRVLLFHDFTELDIPEGRSGPWIVRSTELVYEESPRLTKLVRVEHQAWRWNTSTSSFDRQHDPGVAFGYTPATLGDEVFPVHGFDNLPAGFDVRALQWVDLDGEGLIGMLSEEAGAWYYRRNEGGGAFAWPRTLSTKPSLGLAGHQLADLDRDGRMELVRKGPSAGYHTRDANNDDWEGFSPFQRMPAIDWDDRNLRYLDLDGDGLADILITGDYVHRWYRCEGTGGYSLGGEVTPGHDEEQGPARVFLGDTESIFLADMSGDGLTDLVRVRNGAVCYWPNLGFGKFGPMISLADSPWFDNPDRFDPKRIHLADIDGSGPADLIYIGRDRVQIWYNQSGNSFSEAPLPSWFPHPGAAASVSVNDVLGDGTACLVWSSPLLSDSWQPLRYVRLMADGKPHLLNHIDNQRGGEVRLTYAPSTKFYLTDRNAGTPWVTRLPFPVQVVERTQQLDHITGWRFAQTYAYHHGYYDGVEREFRGFGMVESWDSESLGDFEEGVAEAHRGSVAQASAVRVTTYELGKGAFTGTTYALQLRKPLAADYFVMIDGLQAASPQQASEVGARVTADPFETGDLGDSGAPDVIKLSRGTAANGDWIGTVTVVESLSHKATDGFTLVDVKAVGASAGGSTSVQTTNTASSTTWSDLGQVVLYGGPRGGGSTCASGGSASHTSLCGKLTPSGDDGIGLARHGGGTDLEAATFTVYAVEWGNNHRIERVTVTGDTGSLDYDTAGIPGSSVNRANTWLWASGYAEGKDAGTSFYGLMLALGDGSQVNTTEASVAVGSKHAVERDVLVTVHAHPSLSVDWCFVAEGQTTKKQHTYEVEPPDGAERYTAAGTVKVTEGARLAVHTASHTSDDGNVEGARFAARATADGSVTVRRTATGSWAAHLQVVDFGAVTSSVARSDAQVAHHVPPVHTRTWFHTGAWGLEERFAKDAWAGDEVTQPLAVSLHPPSREAARALKGEVLRQEVYADDDSELADKPFQVTAQRYEVRTVQAGTEERPGVYQVVHQETVTWDYERNPDDPRVLHELTLEVDPYGEVLRAARVAYPRRGSGHEPEQTQCLVVVTEREVIHDDADPEDHYHLGLPAVERSWELTGLFATDDDRFTVEVLNTAWDEATEIAFEVAPDSGVERRKTAEHRTLYWDDTLTDALALGSVGARALVYEAYRRAFPFSWVAPTWGTKVTNAMLEEGGYVQLDGTDTDWWQPSGRSTLRDDAFYLPASVTNPFGHTTTITWDDHDLLVDALIDPFGNTESFAHDYRLLQPWKVTDPNGNMTEVAFDVLGRVIATAVKGKNGEGDTLEEPTSTVTYETHRWVDHQLPNRAHLMLRETHADAETRWLEEVAYSDGQGNVVLDKKRVWPGEAPLRDANSDLVFHNGELVFDHTPERWLATGRVYVNNKGDPVKQYEPFFTSTMEYEDEVQLVEWGVSPILHYDPLGRQIRVDHPDGTFERVELTAWEQRTYDRCDTVLDSDWYTAREHDTNPLVERAVAQSTKHADTPRIEQFDTLGRMFLVEEMPDDETTYATRMELDIEGNVRSVTDARNIVTQSDTYDALGRSAYSDSPDAGETWALLDVADQPVRVFKSGDLTERFTYDALRRPVGLFLTEGMASERLEQLAVYGEFLVESEHPGDNELADDNNLRGHLWRQYDGAGLKETVAHDFKGNPLSRNQKFLADYETPVDWTALLSEDTAGDLDTATSTALAGETQTTTSTFDALDRQVTLTTPDGSVQRSKFNQAGLLERVDIQVRGDTQWTPILLDVDYNARGQRTWAKLSKDDDPNNPDDGAITKLYEYDPKTFRQVRCKTVRASDGKRLMDLRYTYDAAGNVIQEIDDAQQTLFFQNSVVQPIRKFRYDGLYRLVSAQGREHGSLTQTGPDDPTVGSIPHNNDGSAVRTYLQTYVYDEVGNILEMKHQGGTEASPGSVLWHRYYEISTTSNRLLGTSIGSETTPPFSHAYTHSARGAMTSMPHLADIEMNHRDQIRRVDLGTGDEAFYHYDAAGQRVRKVIKRGANVEERLYLGSFEVYRKYVGGDLGTARETVHVSDDEQRIAMIETLTVEEELEVTSPTPRLRFQIGNHLGSTALEVDEAGEIISYEEYHPHGTTAWWAEASGIEVSRKRYRYTGKEKDEETGLCYHGARFYAAWLGRWVSADPIGLEGGMNRYEYVRGNPIRLVDDDGKRPIVPLPLLAVSPTASDRTQKQHVAELKIAELSQRVRESGGEFTSGAALLEAVSNPEITPGDDAKTVLASLLAATSSGHGTQFRYIFDDSGFQEELRDSSVFPGGYSSNQVGHFLTAVSMGTELDPMVNLIGTAALWPGTGGALGQFGFDVLSMASDDVALRLIVGHEVFPDDIADLPAISVGMQFAAGSRELQAAFLAGDFEQILDSKTAQSNLKIFGAFGSEAGEPRLKGSSLADLKLSHAGWRLAQEVKSEVVQTRQQLAEWIHQHVVSEEVRFAP